MTMIKIANAPCSWGVLEFELEGQAAGFEQVLDEIKENWLRWHRTRRLGFHANRSSGFKKRT